MAKTPADYVKLELDIRTAGLLLKKLSADSSGWSQQMSIAITQQLVERGKVLKERRKRHENGEYDGELCTCTTRCQNPCKGECGCPACHNAYNDYLSMPSV